MFCSTQRHWLLAWLHVSRACPIRLCGLKTVWPKYKWRLRSAHSLAACELCLHFAQNESQWVSVCLGCLDKAVYGRVRGTERGAGELSGARRECERELVIEGHLPVFHVCCDLKAQHVGRFLVSFVSHESRTALRRQRGCHASAKRGVG